MVMGAPDGVWLGNTIEHREQVRAEALHPQGHAIDAEPAQRACQLLRDGLGIRLDGHLLRRGEFRQEAFERLWLGERGRAAAEEHRLELRSEQVALEGELGEECVDVGAVLPLPPDDRDEVAVAATVGTERQMDVEVAGHFFSASRFRTARNASCGTSTIPTCFIRFFPAFWRSSSFRLRVMSPP